MAGFGLLAGRRVKAFGVCLGWRVLKVLEFRI